MCVDLSHLWKIQNERCLLNSIFIFKKKNQAKGLSPQLNSKQSQLPSLPLLSSPVWCGNRRVNMCEESGQPFSGQAP